MKIHSSSVPNLLIDCVFIQFITFDWESCYFHLQLSPPHTSHRPWTWIKMKNDYHYLKRNIQARLVGVCLLVMSPSWMSGHNYETTNKYPKMLFFKNPNSGSKLRPSVNQGSASSIHWCLGDTGPPLSAPVLTFVSNIKNVPSQSISDPGDTFICTLLWMVWSQQNKLWHRYSSIFFSNKHCEVLVVRSVKKNILKDSLKFRNLPWTFTEPSLNIPWIFRNPQKPLEIIATCGWTDRH